VHCEAAGDREAAGDHALAAATLAERTLAFERAAQLYRNALRLGRRQRAVWTKLGDALANAGHGEAAAEAYVAAAEGAPIADALELRRRAASQLLRTGHVDRGLALLDDVLRELGMTMPATPRRALASLLWHRARLRVRGLDFARRDARELSPYDLVSLDVL